MTTYIPLLFLALSMTALAANHYFHIYRNDKVADFRRALLGMASQSAQKAIKHRRLDWCEPYDLLDKYSYVRMLYSFRPLTLEAWYTEEEIAVIKGEDLKEKKYEEN